MFRNRMHELKQHIQDPSLIGSKLKNISLSDEITNADDENLDYTKAKQKLKKLKDVILHLQKNGRQYKNTTRPDKQKIIYEKINSKIYEGNQLMQQLKTVIKKINDDFKIQSEKGDQSNLVECKQLTLETSEAVSNFNEAQQKISEDIKSSIHRQANFIQGENISQKQLEDLVLHPEKGQEMLKQKLLDSPSVQLQNCVSDIIDKCNDVLKLERSMRECLGMMEELAILVHLQGEKLLTIEETLKPAHDYVEKGAQKLQNGKQYHKKSKKKMCCIMMLLLTIIGVIVIPIIVTQLK